MGFVPSVLEADATEGVPPEGNRGAARCHALRAVKSEQKNLEARNPEKEEPNKI
jgi:hypothetical protein